MNEEAANICPYNGGQCNLGMTTKIQEKDLLNSEHRWKLKEWVKKHLENKKSKEHYLQYIACNPNGVFYIESYLKQFEEIREIEYNNEDYFKKRHLFDSLCSNPSSQYLLEKNKEFISLYHLSKNESSWAVDILKKNKDEIDWDSLSQNSYAIDILNEYFDEFKTKYDKLYKYVDKCKIKPYNVSANTNAMHIVEEYLQLYLRNIEENKNKKKNFMIELNKSPHIFEDLYNDDNYLLKNPSAISIIENYYFKYEWDIDWEKLSANPNGIGILEQNIDNLNWKGLSLNPSSWAIELLEKNQDKIDWWNLSENQSAIHILEQNFDKSHLFSDHLFNNPSIFELDYEFLYERMNIIRKELLEKTWHPNRVQDWCLYIDEQKDLN